MPRRYRRRRRTRGFNVAGFIGDVAKTVPGLISAGKGIYSAIKNNRTSGYYRRRRRRTGGPPGPPPPPRPPPPGPTMGLMVMRPVIRTRGGPRCRRRTYGVYRMIAQRQGR